MEFQQLIRPLCQTPSMITFRQLAPSWQTNYLSTMAPVFRNISLAFSERFQFFFTDDNQVFSLKLVSMEYLVGLSLIALI